MCEMWASVSMKIYSILQWRQLVDLTRMVTQDKACPDFSVLNSLWGFGIG